MKKYFIYEPENNSFLQYDSEEERDTEAALLIKSYLDDNDGMWPEEVTGIVGGEITMRATEVDRVDRPDDSELDDEDCDKEGICWFPPEMDKICNYEFKEI